MLVLIVKIAPGGGKKKKEKWEMGEWPRSFRYLMNLADKISLIFFLNKIVLWIKPLELFLLEIW